MAKRKAKYPKEIIVVREYNKDESYLVAHEDAESAADIFSEQEVAIYKFVKAAKIRTKTEVV